MSVASTATDFAASRNGTASPKEENRGICRRVRLPRGVSQNRSELPELPAPHQAAREVFKKLRRFIRISVSLLPKFRTIKTVGNVFHLIVVPGNNECLGVHVASLQFPKFVLQARALNFKKLIERFEDRSA